MDTTEPLQIGTYAGRQRDQGLAENAELTHVGPGTPCGEYLRRFWQPVELSSELGELPLAVRILGEDLVLFRAKSGGIGLLGRHCCHRGTSLEYGIVTEEGISCCYHGWHYALNGAILDTPNDPDSRIKETLRHTAYPVYEYKGILFAYMGPTDDVPNFPVMDTWEDPDSELVPFCYSYPCNWLQALENTQDPVHSVFLHTRISGAQFEESWGVLPNVEWVDTPLGMMNVNVRRWKDKIWVRTTELVLPNMNQSGANNETGEQEKYLQRSSACRWFRATDDTNTEIIGWRILNDSVDASLKDPSTYGKNKTPVFGQMDEGRPLEDCQRIPGDFEAIVSQGPITVHAKENLATTDTGVGKLRSLVRRGIRAVKTDKPFVSPPSNAVGAIPTYTQDTVIPYSRKSESETFVHDVGAKVAKIVLKSASYPAEQRKEEVSRAVRALSL